ncbi:NAD(P)/FAD-dependent oxidoreductase [Novipirellula artificiosorum]|uniref:D-amino acid dehydrogenase small subunit n=1 Tax=Novipirellula artificiosorum TaxID=2528016 RepID=A0A5C6DJV6_9BACT|nr:FAD-dependent oxidoreductase [Novipirellula artificiosorum]TWU35871.1 D-amino acid dehydrogenase small subunit [Novipirellula artificiosorum]
MKATGHVAIVGGGVVGIACAHYLNVRGYRVTVVDKNRVGGGCSHGNCGYISPSHALPLAEPGALLKTFKAMLKPNAPLRIRPGLNTQRWKWLLDFARRCNQTNCIESAQAIHPLLTSAMQLYHELIDKHQLKCEWTQQGLLFVYQDRDAWDAYTSTDELLRRDFQEPARKMSAKELLEFEPALRDNVAGAWYFERDAHLRPDRLVASWRDSLRERGVEFLEQQTLTAMHDSGGWVDHVSLSTQQLAADHFVIATGAWTPQLEKMLRLAIPIQPGKGYSITMPRPEVCPNTPMIFPQHKVAVTPWQSELRLGSMMEFIGYDSTINPKRVALLTSVAKQYLKSDFPAEFSETWCGWRPMTYDSTPIIDRCPSFSNVYLAAGHNMLGLSMAPATGRMIGEMIAGEPTHLPAAPYAANRF